MLPERLILSELLTFPNYSKHAGTCQTWSDQRGPISDQPSGISAALA